MKAAYSQTLLQERVRVAQQAGGKRDRLAALLAGDLNFHGEDSSYASHNFHAFAAKFPPQLPRLFIHGLTQPGDVVLDPMMGSGTTIVEALLAARRAIGLDLDPLAFLITQVKTTPISREQLTQAGEKVLSEAATILLENDCIKQALAERFDPKTREFLSYWFHPETQRELMALVLAIEQTADLNIRRFLELTLSSIIVTKSGGVSRARDLAHGRPHRDETKKRKNALEQFSLRFRRNLESISQLKLEGSSPILLQTDARDIPLPNGAVDLVVTSPPYANAIDYMRAHKFSLVWFGKALDALSELRAEYIGSERVGQTPDTPLPPLSEEVLTQLKERDAKRAAVVHKYFIEMALVLKEIYRVLRPDSAAIVVVGPSIMRGISVRTHECLAEIAAMLGFEVVGIVQRALDRNKRMMPARFGQKRASMIEQRMHEEYVIGLYKGLQE